MDSDTKNQGQFKLAQNQLQKDMRKSENKKPTAGLMARENIYECKC